MNTFESISSRCEFQMVADGAGMEPYIHDGDVVLCSTEQPKPGDIAIVSIDERQPGLWQLSAHESGLVFLYRPNAPGMAFQPDEVAARLDFWGTVLAVVHPLDRSLLPNKEAAPDAPTSEAAKGGK